MTFSVMTALYKNVHINEIAVYCLLPGVPQGCTVFTRGKTNIKFLVGTFLHWNALGCNV